MGLRLVPWTPINNTTKTSCSCIGRFVSCLGVLRKRELGRWLSNVVETSPTAVLCSSHLEGVSVRKPRNWPEKHEKRGGVHDSFSFFISTTSLTPQPHRCYNIATINTDACLIQSPISSTKAARRTPPQRQL